MGHLGLLSPFQRCPGRNLEPNRNLDLRRRPTVLRGNEH